MTESDGNASDQQAPISPNSPSILILHFVYFGQERMPYEMSILFIINLS